MTVYGDLGVRTLINAKGTATRLSGGIMRPEVSAAMVEASQACVDIAELQAAASRLISEATGAEAGYVASGASACLLIGAAACITGQSLSLPMMTPTRASRALVLIASPSIRPLGVR